LVARALGFAGLFDEISEIAGFAEITVNRGVAHVRHRIEHRQRLHHHLADRFRGHFALALALQLADDAGDHLLNLILLDWALTQRNRKRARKLVAIERHAPPRALDHYKIAQLHALKGSEARAALVALAATADRGAVLGRTAVFDLAVFVLAKRATHSA